jgi:hypothetical protein
MPPVPCDVPRASVCMNADARVCLSLHTCRYARGALAENVSVSHMSHIAQIETRAHRQCTRCDRHGKTNFAECTLFSSAMRPAVHVRLRAMRPAMHVRMRAMRPAMHVRLRAMRPAMHVRLRAMRPAMHVRLRAMRPAMHVRPNACAPRPR